MINDNLRQAKVDQLTTRDYDLRGRRVKNASDSKDKQDYVTQNELTNATNGLVNDKNLIQKIVDFFKNYTGSLFVNCTITLNKVISALRGLKVALIYPQTDGTEAIVIAKADGTTKILVINSTDFIVESKTTIRATGQSTPTAGTSIEMYYDTLAGADRGIVLAYNRSTSTFKRLDLFGSSVNIQAQSTLGFWGTAAAAKQTLAAYTTNAQNSAYSANTLNATPVTIQYKDWAGANQSVTVVASVGTTNTFPNLADLNALRVAYENLRASYDDLKTKLQNTTLVG